MPRILEQKKEMIAVPFRPAKPCAYPGCSKLTHDRYCEEHKRIVSRRYEMYDRDPDVKRRYGRAWKRIRDSYVKTHPFCEECYEKGILVPVAEVHHVIPLADGGTNERSNLRSLCRACQLKAHGERGALKKREYKLAKKRDRK